jgi:hypothetical protein
MKLTVLIIFFIGLLSIQCMSQDTAMDTLPSSAVVTPSAALIPASQNKMHVNIMAGTEFSTAPGYGSGIATYFLTGITYPVGKRFSIGGGVGILNTTPVGVHSSSFETFGTFGNANSTSTLIYVTGQYLLSQRITVSGTLFKEFSAFNSSPEYQRAQRNLPEGGYMKVDYKINDFMHIEAGFGYSRGVSPYNGLYSGSPIYDSSFPFRNH